MKFLAYQLKITLLGSEPPIWRRVLISGGDFDPERFDLAGINKVLRRRR